MNLTIVVILWAGGFQINVGSFTQGEMIAYINYITQVLLALIVVSNLIILFTKAYTAALRVSEVLNTSPSIISPEILDDLSPLSNAPILTFDNVSFSYYQTGDKAIENISFSINHGETVGIIGATGRSMTPTQTCTIANYSSNI